MRWERLVRMITHPSRIFPLVSVVIASVSISGCATRSDAPQTLTPSSSEAVNEVPPPYGADRKERVEADLNTMWDQDREATQTESSIAARSAARRVFIDMNKTFKGNEADVIAYLGHQPNSRTAEGLVYLVQAPSYTDRYTVLLQDGIFRGVRYEHEPRLISQKNKL